MAEANPLATVHQLHAPKRRRRMKAQYTLVLHLKGYVRTQKVSYVKLDNAIRGAAHRMVRGGDWFQIYTIRDETETAWGGRKGNHVELHMKPWAYDECVKKNPWLLPDYYRRPKE
jgi:hypothetical protein